MALTNQKQNPIPVVPRTMKIVNADGTVTRSGQLLLEQIQAPEVLEGKHADRPSAGSVPDGALYVESDRGILYYSDGSAWHYLAGTMWGVVDDTHDDRPTDLGTNDAGFTFRSTNEPYREWVWSGFGWVLTDSGTDGGGGGGSDVIGPVTSLTASEIGTRYASDPDRLVHLTVGLVPVCPVPEPVTYFISGDNGVTWTWIGWQRVQSAGQVLNVDRLAPGQTSLWKAAAVAGTLGGDPSPISDSALSTLYAGVVRSPSFTVAGLSVPPTTQGITATIGTCSNVIAADGFSQYGVIPPVTYTDPTVVGGTDFFVRITTQDLDASHAAIAAEQAHAGTQITGGSHTSGDPLRVIYTPNLAYIRYRFYVANRNSQGAGDFVDPTTNTLQQVYFNGSATTADHYDVAVIIPPFTPISPDDVFNVTSVTASEVGPKYQDEKAGMHTVIGVTATIDHDFAKPHTVTIWFDKGTGNPIWQGWYSLTSPGQVTRIGDPTLTTDGVRKSGDVWVPANTSQGNWIVYCGAGRIDKGIDPHAYASHAFTVIPEAPCRPDGCTNAQFLPDPSTADPITYSKWSPGIWHWEYYELTFVLPSINFDPNFWFTLVSVQKGATIGGVWTPAPDSEGINEDPTGQWLGRAHVQIGQLPGTASDQQATVSKFGARPSTWDIPPQYYDDGITPYPYRDYRFRLYNVSRLGTDTSGSGGAGTYTLQTSCWPGGADHFTLTPDDKNIGSFNMTAANPATITLPLTGGNGLPLTVEPGAITGAYLGPQSVQAVNMAHDAITAANGALAASSVVDSKIDTVGINKVTYGTAVFAGDVVMSRGLGLPVIILKNTGIFLYGTADSSTGATGLTTKPYVGIQNSGIGLFQGGSPGGSVYLDAVNTAITLYTRNGDTSQPYLTVATTGIVIVNGQSSVAINSNALSLIDKTNGNRLDLNSAGYQISHGLDGSGLPLSNANKMVVSANQIQMQYAGVPRFTLDVDATSQPRTTLSDGGSNSVVLKSTGITLTTTGGNQTVIDSNGVRSLSGTQCVRNAGGIGVQLWNSWNEATQTGDTSKPFIGLESSTGNVYIGVSTGPNPQLLTLSGGQMTFAAGSGPTTVITNSSVRTNSVAAGQAGVIPFVLTCDFFPTAGSLAGYREEKVNGNTYKVPLYNL